MKRSIRRRQTGNDRGIVIVLVAVVLLFVVGAIAVLAIDVVTFYTARSEAQLAADAAALAGARVMAYSGATSSATSVDALAKTLAIDAANQVAAQNKVGGQNLQPSFEVDVTFPPSVGDHFDPRVQVKVTRTSLPTFFARVFGSTFVTVSATATAEAYNPSGAALSLAGIGAPVAPTCVKPWLLPNLNPTGAPGAIFNPDGSIVDTTLVGQDWQLETVCDSCTTIPGPAAGKYYPAAIDPTGADPQQFAEPTQSLPTCTSSFAANAYQVATAACVRTPISCGLNADYQIDVSTYVPTGLNRHDDTVQAAKCMIHDKGADDDTDSIDSLAANPPFQYIAGNENPIPGASSHHVLVSDSLVTIPVLKSGAVSSPVKVVGFLQVFLNRDGATMSGPTIKATIVNMAGCGDNGTGQPVFGNGSSAVPVRLVANP